VRILTVLALLLPGLTLAPALAGEPPLLADLVASGKLPPEAERLPSWQVGLSDIVKRALVKNVSAVNAILFQSPA